MSEIRKWLWLIIHANWNKKISKTDFLQTKKMWNMPMSQIAQNLSHSFFFNFGSKCNSPLQINCRFSSNPQSRLAFTTLDGNWIAHAHYLSACSCDAMYQERENRSKLELFYWLFIYLFCHILLALGFLKLLLHIPKWINVFHVLKWFLVT